MAKKEILITGSIKADQNPLQISDASRRAVADLSWTSIGTTEVEVRVGAPDGALLSRSGSSGSVSTGKWVYDGMTFFLQDVSNGKQLTADNTLSIVTINVVSAGERGCSLIKPDSGQSEQAFSYLQGNLADQDPPVGAVRFGDLRRTTPISRVWGADRGLPVDRYYIENFIAKNSEDIRGRVLTIGDDGYIRMFGGSKVAQSDVLNLLEGDPNTTIVGDLTDAPHIPSNTFDCIICPQTLQLIYDVKASIQTLFRILKPRGILLATFPGISQTYDREWSSYWCWNFTPYSATRLFGEVFPPEAFRVEGYGNVLAAVSFLHGLSVEELHKKELDHYEPGYEILITVRAVKPGDDKVK